MLFRCGGTGARFHIAGTTYGVHIIVYQVNLMYEYGATSTDGRNGQTNLEKTAGGETGPNECPALLV